MSIETSKKRSRKFTLCRLYFLREARLTVQLCAGVWRSSLLQPIAARHLLKLSHLFGSWGVLFVHMWPRRQELYSA